MVDALDAPCCLGDADGDAPRPMLLMHLVVDSLASRSTVRRSILM